MSKRCQNICSHILKQSSTVRHDSQTNITVTDEKDYFVIQCDITTILAPMCSAFMTETMGFILHHKNGFAEAQTKVKFPIPKLPDVRTSSNIGMTSISRNQSCDIVPTSKIDFDDKAHGAM